MTPGSGLFPKPDVPPMTLRPYQAEAVAAVYDHLRTRDDNPCVVIPTAGGKTPVMSTICRDAAQKWGGRVLVLAHVKELLEQTVEKLHNVAPDMDELVGVYSAGLRRRDTQHPIIVAGIQSIYRRAAELDAFDLILIDEAHMIPPGDSGGGEGMYRTFLREARLVNPHVRLIGLTATPYRMSTGTICGPDNLLNHVCYEVGVRELIVQGYLCPLKSKAGRRKADTSGLRTSGGRGGEFVASEVEQLMDTDELVGSACREIVAQTQDRNSVLIFAAGVDHALHIQKVLESMGCECGFVCGDTLPFERTQTLARFKSGELRYLVNVNVLTTGFDAPNIDCVALLRPTMSPGLYYQMVGRGFRLHPSKENCLVLDFAGNILRHGPVDALQVEDRTPGSGEAPAKECPACSAIIHAAYTVCPECGHEFPDPQKQKHEREAASAGVLTGEVTETEYDVQDVYYSVHAKRGAPDDHPRTLRVDYQVGFNDYQSEWVCVEHTGYARQKAEAWWRRRSNEPMPATAEDAVAICDAGGIADTTGITVRSVAGERFDRIVEYQLGPVPPRLDGGDEREADALHESVPIGIPDDEIPF